MKITARRSTRRNVSLFLHRQLEVGELALIPLVKKVLEELVV